MNFVTRPSLKRTALIQIAETLWNQHDIRDLIEEFSNSQLRSPSHHIFFIGDTRNEKEKEWRKIEERVLEKVPQLIIPTSLKEQLLCFIQPVGFQILKWKKYHLECCGFGLNLPNKFCWTIHGIIDKKKTAAVLIKDEAIDIIKRFELACIYCLEDDIAELWYKLPEAYKNSFLIGENIEKSFQMHLLLFWVQCMREKEENSLIRFLSHMVRCFDPSVFSDQYLFEISARKGNKAATEYFLQKLIQSDELLLNTAIQVKNTYSREIYLDISKPPKDCYGEVLSFLISQMNDDQLSQIFKECPFAVLHCLFDWPCQNLFVETASRLWNFLPNLTYHEILMRIIEKINQVDCMDYNYRKMFVKLWQQTPHSHKSSFINDYDYMFYVLNELLLNEDKESIKLIFQDMTLTERNKLIFNEDGLYLFKGMIRREEWSLIKFYVRLCISSKHEMIKFKQEFEEYIPRLQEYPYETAVYTEDRMKKFFRILDDFICMEDKRKSLDEGDSNPPKRFCNIELTE